MPSERNPLIGFGLVIIGDEILIGKRQDRHFEGFRALLGERGYQVAWCWVLPDDPELIVNHLRLSMGLGGPVFVCGGIGATPDDHTRACAAEAAGVALERHPGAAREIEARFGGEAYPNRILMADLPAGSVLIPNPYNRIPGFSLRGHYFLPGFPEMAWPMAEWVLDANFPGRGAHLEERSVWVTGVPESRLVPIMRELMGRFPQVKLFSLPRLGEVPGVELGIRGGAVVGEALGELRRLLDAEGISHGKAAPNESASESTTRAR